MRNHVPMIDMAVDEYFLTSVQDLLSALSSVQDAELNLCSDIVDSLNTLCFEISRLRSGTVVFLDGKDQSNGDSVEDILERIGNDYYSITFGLLCQGQYTVEDAQRMTKLFCTAFPTFPLYDDDFREALFTGDYDLSREIRMHHREYQKTGFSPVSRILLNAEEFTSALDTGDYNTLNDLLGTIYSCGVPWNVVHELLATKKKHLYVLEDIHSIQMMAELLEQGVIGIDDTRILHHVLLPVNNTFMEQRFWLPVYQNLKTVQSKKRLVDFVMYAQAHAREFNGIVETSELSALLNDESTEFLPHSLLSFVVIVSAE